MLYDVIGKISIVLGLITVGLIFLTLFLGAFLLKKNRFVFPKVMLFTIDTLYLQLMKIAKLFGMGPHIVDQIGIEIRNHLNNKKFMNIKGKDRILVVPQCLRSVKCPARLDSSVGIACKDCGLCVIKELKAEADRLGYGFYIVPGGRFVERIVKKIRPRAALGVACFKDLNMGMHELSKAKCLVVGVPLIKDGCVETNVNINQLLSLMKLGIEQGAGDIQKGCSPELGLKDAKS
ncbi:MAG: DUF116 domain-containing protein [Candidatus Hydrothermarchaeaceae archaeon]